MSTELLIEKEDIFYLFQSLLLTLSWQTTVL